MMRPTLILATIGLFAGSLAAAPAPGDAADAPPSAAQMHAQTQDQMQDQLSAYQTALDNAKRLIERLQAELDQTRAHAAALEAALQAHGIELEPQPTEAQEAAARLAAQRQAERQRRARALERLAEEKQREARQEKLARARKAQAPAWTYTWQLGYISLGTNTTTFIKTGPDGTVFFTGDSTNVDRRQLKLRGTFENRSTKPWRYTFDIRVAEQGYGGLPASGRYRHISATTRYQTPVLGPGELHRWEVTLTVEDSLQVRTADIGNVRADPPPPEPAAATPAGQ